MKKGVATLRRNSLIATFMVGLKVQRGSGALSGMTVV